VAIVWCEHNEKLGKEPKVAKSSLFHPEHESYSMEGLELHREVEAWAKKFIERHADEFPTHELTILLVEAVTLAAAETRLEKQAKAAKDRRRHVLRD
jgi:hypothetical protein